MAKSKSSEKVIYLCDGKKCCKYNSEVRQCFKELVKEAGLKYNVYVEKMKCQGMCKQAPVVCIHKSECIGKVSKEDAVKLFEKHIA